MSIQANTIHTQPDYEQLRVEIRGIVDEVIKPRAELIDREGRFPRENLSALAEAGWNGVLIPEALRWTGTGSCCLCDCGRRNCQGMPFDFTGVCHACWSRSDDSSLRR